MVQIQQIQVLLPGRYTARELKFYISRTAKRDVPDRTVRWYRHQLGISPDEDGFYSQDDLDTLQDLVRSLKRGVTVKQFFKLLQEQRQCQST